MEGNISGTVWSEQEKALLAFVDEVIAGPEVSDVVFDNVRRCFSDQALVEVVTMQVGKPLIRLTETHKAARVSIIV